MKKLFQRILTALMLSFGIIFGANLLISSPTPVIAIGENETTTDTPDATDDNPAEDDSGSTTETPSEDSSDEENPADATNTAEEENVSDVCQDQTGALGWIICPSSGLIANATDKLYGAIEDMLIVTPLSIDQSSPIYLTWQYARNITNIVFAIFLLVVIYSQLTGIGLRNYGIKRILPRLIIAIILVNLSFIICSIAVDASNIIGASLRDFFTSIEEAVISGSEVSVAVSDFSLSHLLAVVLSGGMIAGVTISAVGGAGYIFFMLLVVLLGAIVAVVSGLITIAARQALVALLVMISPLAFVAYLLPNTERWFNKWKDLLFRMLIFYPMFSFLFGASHLVGYSLVTSANSATGIILGIAVQIFPLFFSWSLMKMSGTILSSINRGVRQLSSPLQRSLTGWSLGHAEQARQAHIANSNQSGARLRRYLDSRRELRELDTRNSMQIRKGRALEGAYRTASSSTGRDKQGNDTWRRRANRYTVNAKRASYYETVANTSAAAYKNTLGGFGRHFEGDAAASLADAHGEAYKEAMKQQFLSVNEAQADQEWLLNQYIDAQANINKDPYEYNRLVKSAAGGLGHTGESSIMGQVIIGNSQIENRRRTEGRIMITKFGIKKPIFRSMVLDKQFVNDDGFETDSGGRLLEDDQYRLMKGCTSTPWQQYIGVHKTTGEEISKEQFDALSESDRSNYRRVKYFDITDDKGNPVQRVYDDDAGYMKELLRDDIAIGDPINRRYATVIGVGRNGRPDGILRKYHSTIHAALIETRYKDHAAEMTPMLGSQANSGYIGSIGMYNIANLQSLTNAAKPGSFLQNDAYAIKTWQKLISCIDNDENFAHYFPDEDIMDYLNVNGKELPGFILSHDDDGNPIWKKIDADVLRNEYTNAQILEYRKNFIKHKVLPEAAKKLIGMADRNISPNVSENQKPDTMAALDELAHFLADIAVKNNDSSIDFADRLNGNIDLLDVKDPSVLRYTFREARKRSQAMNDPTGGTGGDDNNNTGGSYTGGGNGGNGGGSTGRTGGTGGSSGGTGSSGGGGGGPRPQPSGPTPTGGAAAPSISTPRPATRPGTTNFLQQLERGSEAERQYNERNNITNILSIIDDCCDCATNIDNLATQILDYFSEVECLQPLIDECSAILDNYRYDNSAQGTMEAISQIANREAHERQRIEMIRAEVKNLIMNRAETS